MGEKKGLGKHQMHTEVQENISEMSYHSNEKNLSAGSTWIIHLCHRLFLSE